MTIHQADYPYTGGTKGTFAVGPVEVNGGSYVYLQAIKEDDVDHWSCTTLHVSAERAREIAYDLLDAIGDSIPESSERTQVLNINVHDGTAELPPVGDLPAEYLFDVIQYATRRSNGEAA